MIYEHYCDLSCGCKQSDWQFESTLPSQKGWECPKCGRCYSPGYPWCDFCGKQALESLKKPEKEKK